MSRYTEMFQRHSEINRVMELVPYVRDVIQSVPGVFAGCPLSPGTRLGVWAGPALRAQELEENPVALACRAVHREWGYPGALQRVDTIAS